MRLFRTLLSVICLLTASSGLAEEGWFEGQVLLIDDDGHVQPLPQPATLRVHGQEMSTSTESNQGTFRLRLPKGPPLTLDVDLKGYGVCVSPGVPANLLMGTDVTRVSILLTAADQEVQAACSRRMAAGIVGQVNWPWPTGTSLRKLESAYFVKSWARQHGLDASMVSKALEQWRQVGVRQERVWEQALAAFIAGDYEAALRHANSAVRVAEQQPQKRKARAEAAQALNLMGVVYNANTESARALKAYERTSKFVAQQEDQTRWASVEYGMAHANAILSKSEGEARKHLERAAQHYRQVLTAYKREKSPLVWATLQANIATALMRQAALPEGTAVQEQLKRAEQLYQEALAAYSYEQVPDQWILIHARLGSVLFDQGQTERAISEYKVALQPCARDASTPECWLVQRDFAYVLQSLGKKLEGEVGVERLRESVAVYRVALQMYRQKEGLNAQASVQSELGSTLIELGTRVAAQEGLLLLTEAAEMCRQALSLYGQAGTPEDSAAVRSRLVIALTRLVEKLMGGGESPKLLEEAMDAAQGALEVYTFERHPSQWAEAQVNRGVVLMMKGGLVLKQGGVARAAEAVELLEAATKAFESSLRVYTHEKAPKQRAAVRAILCTTRRSQSILAWDPAQAARLQEEVARACSAQPETATREDETERGMRLLEIVDKLHQRAKMVDGKEKKELLDDLLSRCGEALQIFTTQRAPQAWATVQNVQAAALLMQMETVESREEKIHIADQAIAAYRELLKVYTREQWSQPWAAATSSMGVAFAERGRWLKGQASIRSLEEAVRLHQETLTVHSRDVDPVAWATTQDNLCYALKLLGVELEGESGARRIQEAIEACQQALTVFSAEQHPEYWGQVKRNLEHARRKLLERGEQIRGELPPADEPQTQAPLVANSASAQARSERKSPAAEVGSLEAGRWLSGQILIIDATGSKRPPPRSATVRLRYFNSEATTSPGDGSFKLPLPETVVAGDRVSLEVVLDGYEVISPWRGGAQVPEPHTGESVQVLLRPTGSKFITDAVDAVRLTEWFAEEMKLQALYSQRPGLKMGPPQSFGSSWTLEAEARRLGVSREELEAEYRKQLSLAELIHGSEARQLLDFFTKGDYQAALEHAERLTSHWEQRLAQATGQGTPREVKEARDELARALWFKGEIYQMLQDLPMSRASYLQALRHAQREQNAHWWAVINGALGSTLAVEALLAGGSTSRQSLHDAMRYLMLAMEVHTRERAPEEWAKNQSMLGFVLFHMGMRETGQGMRRRLEEAVTAYRRALEVLDTERLSIEWAEAQSWHAQALTQLGRIEGGARGMRLLEEAEEITEQVLKIYTRARTPLKLSTTYSNLSKIYYQSAMMGSGDAQAQKLVQAQAALEQAFSFIDRKKDPRGWADLRIELCRILSSQGEKEKGERGRRRVEQAAEMCGEALAVMTADGAPQLWAAGNLNLGTALLAQLYLQAGATKAEEQVIGVLERAQRAFMQVLAVTSREDLPQEWTRAHVGLCLVGQGLGQAYTGQQGVRLLEQAVESCRAVSVVFTREHEPQQWASGQFGQAKALTALAERLGGEAERRLLEGAASAYSRLLLASRHVSIPMRPAEVHSGLSASLARLESLYRESLAGSPGDPMAQGLLAENLLLQGRYKESADMLTSLSGNSQLTPHMRIRVKLLALIARSATGEQGSFVQELEELRALIASQGDEFEAGDATDAMAYLVEADTKLTAQKRWLGSLLQVLQASGRDGMLQALSDCRRMHQAVQGEP